MSEQHVWWGVYGVVAASLFVISGLILWFSRLHAYKIPQYLLAVFFFSGGYVVFINFLIETRYILDYPHFHRTAVPFILISFPLVYLYYKKSERQLPLNPKELLHFILPLSSILYFLPYYFSSAALKVENLEQRYDSDRLLFIYRDSFDTRFNPLLLITIFIFLFYFIRTLFHLIKLRRPEFDSVLWKKPGHAQWLFSFFILSQLQPLTSLLALMVSGNIYLWEINTIGMGVLAIIVSSYILTQPSVIYGEDSQEKTRSTRNITEIKRTASVQKHSKAAPEPFDFEVENFDIYRKFLSMMLNEKIFLKNRLSIGEVAETMQVDKELLQKCIEMKYKMPFHELMNQFRINHVIGLVKSGELKNLSMEQIALSSGFGNRTTFISAFKKVTGLTPSEYFQRQGDHNMGASE